MTPKTLDQARLFTLMVAQKQGWELNQDAAFYDSLVEGLTVNFNRYGYFLCPCRDSEGSREADKKAICPCVWTKLDIPEFGHCFCALYLSREFSLSGVSPSGIPDRRYEE